MLKKKKKKGINLSFRIAILLLSLYVTNSLFSKLGTTETNESEDMFQLSHLYFQAKKE